MEDAFFFFKEIIKSMIISWLAAECPNCENLLMLMMVIMAVEKYLNNKKAMLLMKCNDTICND